MAVVVGRRGRKRKRRGVLDADGRQIGCASCPAIGAGAVGPTGWSGGYEGWENAEGWDWTSGLQPPRAVMEEKWGTKRGEGENWEVEENQ